MDNEEMLQHMSVEEVIKELRNSKGWPMLGNVAADRMEILLRNNNTMLTLVGEMSSALRGCFLEKMQLEKQIMEIKHGLL